jgi:hypothetical protein
MALDQPDINLELDEGEQILYIGRRHWIELVQSGFVFIVIGVITGLLAVYRGIGGMFIVPGVGAAGLDLTNTVILVLIVLLGVLWQRGAAQRKKNKNLFNTSVFYLIAVGTLGLLFLFRMEGGRLLYIDPLEARPFDLINLGLLTVTLLMVGLMVYLYIDWVDDYLVLTNTRVVYDDDQFLVRHIQQQILIDDIQQVNMRADSYLAHWLGYGKLILRSFSPRSLEFNYAANPREIEKRILDEVNKLRKAQSTEMLRQLIEDRVYHNKPPKKPGPAIHVHERAGPIPWIFKPNPEIDFEKETIIWRPAWPFLALALLRPLGSLLLILIALVVCLRLDFLPVLWVSLIGLVGLLACGGWLYWIYEEHENDLYILTRQDITDVDKKPFGPENRRRAPLNAIQDVSFDVSYFESVLGFGTVVIQTGGAAGGKFTFNHVPDPRNVQATINDYLTDAKKREKERQFQDSVTLLHEYHHLQTTKGELMDQARISALVSQQVREQRPSTGTTEIIQQLPPGPSQDELQEAVRRVVREELLRIRLRQRSSPEQP